MHVADQPVGWLATTKEPEEFQKGISNTFEKKVSKLFGGKEIAIQFASQVSYLTIPVAERNKVLAPDASELGTLTDPRDFNLMFKTIVGALGTDDDAAYLRPETAQGIFVNFKNVCDSTRVRVPFGIAQSGKSFRNEITPKNFTSRFGRI